MIAWALAEISGTLAGAGAAVLAVLIAWITGRTRGRQDARAQADRAALDVERNRQEIVDEIQQDPDLAARARSTGLVRPDR